MLLCVKTMSSHSDLGTKSPKKTVKSTIIQEFFQGFLEILSSIESRDPPTRRMGLIFWMSFGLVFLLGGIGIERYQAYHQERSAARSLSEALERQRQERITEEKDAVARTEESSADLGLFTSTLPATADDALAPGHPVFIPADVDVVVQLDSPLTRKFVEDHLDQARNQAIEVLATLQREELLTSQGKRQTQARLLRQMNAWLGKNGIEGKARAVSFTQLVVH